MQIETILRSDFLHYSSGSCDVYGNTEPKSRFSPSDGPAASSTKVALKAPGIKAASNSESVSDDLPYAFTCPSSHAEWLQTIKEVKEVDIDVVIRRILTLYHPSLGAGNKERLSASGLVFI